MKKLIFTFVLTSITWGSSQQREKYNIKAAHLGPNAVAIVCLNGADPTGIKQGDVLIISCGK